MSEEGEKQLSNWLKLTPNLEHFDPFAGLSDGLTDTEQVRHVRYGFLIAGQRILIEKSIICEVVPNSYIYPIPNTPAWVTGMINLRGNLIPVFNLGRLFSGEGKEYSAARKNLLIIDRGERAVATFIDDLPAGLEIDEATAERVDATADAADLVRNYTLSAYSIGGDVWHEIDHDALFRTLTSELNKSELSETKHAEPV